MQNHHPTEFGKIRNKADSWAQQTHDGQACVWLSYIALQFV